jgi:hypothetical protein
MFDAGKQAFGARAISHTARIGAADRHKVFGARENKNVATLIPQWGNLVVVRHAMESSPRDTR